MATPPIVLLPALAILAAGPVLWLVRTWFDPGYASHGEWAAAATLGLLLHALASPRVAPPGPERRAALALFGLAAVVRLVSERAAVRTIGALALGLDVLALALHLGLGRRARPISPLGLTALFLLSLPTQRIVERLLGHPLQLASAGLAERGLGALGRAVVREGTLLEVDGARLSIDLPCSGAQGLDLLLFAFAFGWARGRLTGLRVPLGLAAAIALAVVANGARLVALALASARFGSAALAEPWHSLVGLGPLALAALAVSLLGRPEGPRVPCPVPVPEAGPIDRRSMLLGGVAAALAVAVVSVSPRPLDVGEPPRGSALPSAIDDWQGSPLAPSPAERSYYATFGGQLEKRRYERAGQAVTVVLVRTTAPLRHVHAPDECLVGAGHAVRLLGVRPDRTSVYASVAPDGAAFRVAVSFVGPGGERATTPSEVAWRALSGARGAWTVVQRITPLEQCDLAPADCAAFERALFGALELLDPGEERTRAAEAAPTPEPKETSS